MRYRYPVSNVSDMQKYTVPSLYINQTGQALQNSRNVKNIRQNKKDYSKVTLTAIVGLKSSSRFCCCFISDRDDPSSPASFGKNPSSVFMIQSTVCIQTIQLLNITRSSATAEKQRVSCPRGGGLGPRAHSPSAPSGYTYAYG